MDWAYILQVALTVAVFAPGLILLAVYLIVAPVSLARWSWRHRRMVARVLEPKAAPHLQESVTRTPEP